jgi:hypothetical protein
MRESLLLGSPEERKAEEEAWNLAYQSLDRKEGEARAATLKMLFNWPPEHTPPEIVNDLNRKMSSSLLSLGARDQQELLDPHWDVLRSPEIVPVLRQMAAPSPEAPGSKEMRAAYRGYPQATALFRWYEVDPAEAHEEILRQISSAQPTLNADAIDFLPGESLPQSEAIWADALKRNENEDRQGGSPFVGGPLWYGGIRGDGAPDNPGEDWLLGLPGTERRVSLPGQV